MKKALLSALIICFGAFIPIACTSSQFTLYKPSDNEPAWRVTVEQRPELMSPRFICIVNDSSVVEGLFEIFKDNFEKDGTYRARPVKIAGYRTSHTTFDAKGQASVTSSYQIRVFISEREVGKFDF
jgi:hypothetical protein